LCEKSDFRVSDNVKVAVMRRRLLREMRETGTTANSAGVTLEFAALYAVGRIMRPFPA
jgi:hypothetical protein